MCNFVDFYQSTIYIYIFCCIYQFKNGKLHTLLLFDLWVQLRNNTSTCIRNFKFHILVFVLNAVRTNVLHKELSMPECMHAIG